MEKINYHKQELDLADRLEELIKASRNSHLSSRQIGRVTDPATSEQLQILSRHGIRPLWIATRKEAEEMIFHYKVILNSAKR